jgi:hypothetical protein
VRPSRYVVEKGQIISAWYAVYNDGWIEQGSLGVVETTNKTFTFPKPFSDTDYLLLGVGFYISGEGRQSVNKTSTGFNTGSDLANSGTESWYACGY